MYGPARDDEITSLLRYIDQQLEAIRASAVGLTEEQARSQPCASALSIGALIKHANHVMDGLLTRLADPTAIPTLDEAAFARYRSSLVVADGESVAALRDEFDALRVRYVAAIAAADPSTETMSGPAPWQGIYDARPSNLRYYLVHQVEEFARHAGHADIIREQIDGTSIATIVLSEAGVGANDFFTPYVAAEGTIGAA